MARAEAGKGWRVWDRMRRKPWGDLMAHYPEALLTELNGPKRPEMLVELTRPRV